MKRKPLIFAAVCAVLVLLLSCELFFGAASSLLPWDATTESWTYASGKEVMYELPYHAKILNLTLPQTAHDIFMVRMNPTERAISAYNTRYLVSAGRSAESGASARSAIQGGAYPGENVPRSGGFVRRDHEAARSFVPPAFGTAVRARFADAAAAVSGPQRSVTQISPEVGTTKKDICVDTAAGKYERESSTLRAVGENCYVWVVDGFHADTTDSSSKQKITTQTAQEIAAKFDEIYPFVRHIFGSESDVMVDVTASGAESFPAIAEVSDTGTMVNIVVYDIEGDWASSANGGTYGYFWAKDYYSAEYAAAMEGDAGAIGYTNEGKYFYMDSYFANEDRSGIYSTLAHEFQHMINFGQKTMAALPSGKVVSSSTWYTEMLSMLCEDLMQEKLGLVDEGTPRARLPWFCLGYYASGVIDWLEGENVLYSYATAYTFGAYLARNFGGPELVKAIATNGYVDRESITRALQTLGKNETFDSAFRKYAQALILDNPASGAAVSLNKSAGLATPYESYSYPLKAIDIFNVSYEPEENKTETVAPYLFPSGAEGRADLRPYGFTLHRVGTGSGAVQLEFSRPSSTSEKVYVLVQPCNHESH